MGEKLVVASRGVRVTLDKKHIQREIDHEASRNGGIVTSDQVLRILKEFCGGCSNLDSLVEQTHKLLISPTSTGGMSYRFEEGVNSDRYYSPNWTLAYVGKNRR